jgi:hypothetical protein
MGMKLDNGSVVSNAKENKSVFGPHFQNQIVLDNHRPVNLSVLELMQPRCCLTSIDKSIAFA